MSSSDMPELGSKISLISKADIRYEGKLCAVDPQDCTIALANVKSFGTEDRKTANRVPPQKDAYDYILFRATDIKDISVVPAPQQLLYDPAIVQLSAPPNLGSRYGSGGSAFSHSGHTAEHTNYSHPVLGQMGSHQPFSSAAPGGGSSSTGGGGGANTGGFNPMHSGIHNLTRPSPSEFLHHHNNDMLTGSRSSTPPIRKPSPTVDQSTQANSQQQRRPINNSPQHQQKDRNQAVFYRSVNRNQDNRNSGNLRNNPRNDQQSQMQQQQQRQRSYNQQGGGGLQPQNRGGWGQHQQPQQQRGGSGTGGGGMNSIGNRQQRLGGGGGGGGRRGGPGGPTGSVGGGLGNFSRAPGVGGIRKSSTPLKFESDYDFDKYNTEFEELFSKLKIEPNESTPAPTTNGVTNGDKLKEDTNTETGIANDAGGGDTTVAVESSVEQVVFYNKTKSFFDNISCEAVERSKGRSQRTDWRKERKLNTETFGVSSARRGLYGRGGSRGGGGYYYGNRGTGGYYGNRGGYRTGSGGLFKQQNKPPYRTQQPQVAKA